MPFHLPKNTRKYRHHGPRNSTCDCQTRIGHMMHRQVGVQVVRSQVALRWILVHMGPFRAHLRCVCVCVCVCVCLPVCLSVRLLVCLKKCVSKCSILKSFCLDPVPDSRSWSNFGILQLPRVCRGFDDVSGQFSEWRFSH